MPAGLLAINAALATYSGVGIARPLSTIQEYTVAVALTKARLLVATHVEQAGRGWNLAVL